MKQREKSAWELAPEKPSALLPDKKSKLIKLAIYLYFMLEVKWNYPSMDDWQKEVVEFTKNIIENWDKRNSEENNKLLMNLILMCGRQVGKSEIIAYCVDLLLLNIPKIKLLIVSGVERQASGLYQKILNNIAMSEPKMLTNSKKDRPLKTKFSLKNGSKLITEPVGTDGSGARQHTLHGVIFEEMQLIPEEAFAAITPMLLTTGGFIWMLGTAWSTEGFVYERLSDPEFYVKRVNAEEVAEKRPEPQRTIMLNWLENERKRMTAANYQQEYLAIPSDKTRQIFPDALIKRCMDVERPNNISESFDYVCGADPAGLGKDEGSISIFKINSDTETAIQTDHIITTNLYTTEFTDRIVSLNQKYDFNKIYVDDGGVGFGVFSELLKEDDTKYKTIPLNNSARPLDAGDEREKKILGVEMVINLLNQMEKGKVHLLQDAEIRESLKSYKFEYSDKGQLLVSSNYNHPVQSIMRAVWHLQRKSLKLSVHSIRV
jgi:hypothetical protein